MMRAMARLVLFLLLLAALATALAAVLTLARALRAPPAAPPSALRLGQPATETLMPRAVRLLAYALLLILLLGITSGWIGPS
jgi:hypothetical protein